MSRTRRHWPWRRSMRGVGGSQASPPDHGQPQGAELRFDSWLHEFHGDRLAALDAACAKGAGADRYRLFRDLDDDLWAMLLTQQYDSYPHIRELLPDMPNPGLQALWNGASGVALTIQGKDFYAKLRASYQRHGPCALEDARVLDFGCGWGRIMRFLARDVRPNRLFGCDPVDVALELCHSTGVPGAFAKSEFLPDRLPFGEKFDLIYAFSVFTHLSETAHERALNALHDSLRQGGVLVMTIRPPAYRSELTDPLADGRSPDEPVALNGPSYLFVPHQANPWQAPPRPGEEVAFGKTVFTLDYLRTRWGSLFELLETNFLLSDPFQVMLTLRRV